MSRLRMVFERNEMKEYFPLFIDISKKNILIVGAGKIAYRRTKVLVEFNAKIKIVACEIDEKFLSLEKERKAYLDIEKRKFRKEDIKNIDIVLACTNDPKLNTEIVNFAKKENILYNSCTDKEECSFYFPSIIRDKDLCIGINAKGNAHSRVKESRKKIEESLFIKNNIEY